MSKAATDTGPVCATVVLVQRVRPGRENEYLRWQAEINDDLDAWLRSDARQAQLARSQDVLDESQQQIVAGRGTAQHVSGMVVATRVMYYTDGFRPCATHPP